MTFSLAQISLTMRCDVEEVGSDLLMCTELYAIETFFIYRLIYGHSERYFRIRNWILSSALSPNVHMDVISWKSICWLCQWKWWHKLLVSKWEKWVSQSNTQRYVYHDLYICTQKRLPSTFSINLQHPAIFTFVCRQDVQYVKITYEWNDGSDKIVVTKTFLWNLANAIYE